MGFTVVCSICKNQTFNDRILWNAIAEYLLYDFDKKEYFKKTGISNDSIVENDNNENDNNHNNNNTNNNNDQSTESTESTDILLIDNDNHYVNDKDDENDAKHTLDGAQPTPMELPLPINDYKSTIIKY